MICLRIWRLTIAVYCYNVCGVLVCWGKRGYGQPQTVIGHWPRGR